MRRIGTISYNIYCNFTNYGSALQTWALHQVIKKTGNFPVLIDYCPDILADKDPLNPFVNMWDQDENSKHMVELSMPAIKRNFQKFDRFYGERFFRTKEKYDSKNFNEVFCDESLNGFVCGSDTIFCPDEFGFDDGYFANYSVMQKRSVSYAASFGDPHFTLETYKILSERLKNFKALGIRENKMIPYVKTQVEVPVMRTIDPTLLLSAEEYDPIISKREYGEKYLLLYERRYSSAMEAYAEEIAQKNGWKIIDISLRAINAERGHVMAYDAGVEEFLSLVKHAQYVVTNSYHGMIFSVQFRRRFAVFSREQCDNKIEELLDLLGMSQNVKWSGNEKYHEVNRESDFMLQELLKAGRDSYNFLKMELELL